MKGKSPDAVHYEGPTRIALTRLFHNDAPECRVVTGAEMLPVFAALRVRIDYWVNQLDKDIVRRIEKYFPGADQGAPSDLKQPADLVEWPASVEGVHPYPLWSMRMKECAQQWQRDHEEEEMELKEEMRRKNIIRRMLPSGEPALLRFIRRLVRKEILDIQGKVQFEIEDACWCLVMLGFAPTNQQVIDGQCYAKINGRWYIGPALLAKMLFTMPEHVLRSRAVCPNYDWQERSAIGNNVLVLPSPGVLEKYVEPISTEMN